MAKTSIEWTDAVWNPIRGCSRVSEGCRSCYAERVANRFKGPGMPYEGLIAKGGQWNGNIKIVEDKLREPLSWIKPRMVFVNSMSDLFHESVPFETIAAIFSVMSVTTRHTYQILTKRPARMLEFFDWAIDFSYPDFPDDSRIVESWPFQEEWQPVNSNKGGYDNCGPAIPYKNIWLGVSVEDQKTADERIPLLLKVPAAVRWISAEPLLESINLKDIATSLTEIMLPLAGITWTAFEHETRVTEVHNKLDWVVVGGETGVNARPMHADWVRTIRDQCAEAGTPFFFKQWGEWGFSVQGACFTNAKEKLCLKPGTIAWRTGKKKAGRELDGRTWDEYPEREA